jgi:transcriptional regulator with XRE-family HTH domain
MPQKPKLNLPPLDLGNEKAGERIARLRKEKGLTQKQLAEKMGLIQSLISSYERSRLRLNAEMVARFAKALSVSCDEIIGLKKNEATYTSISLRFIKRINKIEALPKSKQKWILKMIDALIRDAENNNL